MLPVALNGAEVRTLKNNTTGDSLHVIASRGLVFSSWRFSPEELIAVKAGKPVWLIIRGELVPEMTMTVGDRNEVVPPEIIKRAQKQDAILKGPEVAAMVKKQLSEDRLVDVVMWAYITVMAAVIVAALGYVVRFFLGR